MSDYMTNPSIHADAIVATPDELAALPFNPVYAEVRLVPANGAGENPYGKGVGR